VPGEPGVLILMNHQSVLDIPMVIASVEGVFPRIVTRERYAKWIPVISHTIRELKYPVVNPGAKAGTVRRHLEKLEQVAATSEVPLLLFPEGTRTRNGKIGRFQTAGSERILRARNWKVYVFVSDGYWRHAKWAHFKGGMQDLKGHLSVLGPFEWSDPGADSADFMDRMRGLMVDELARVRAVEADRASGTLPARDSDQTPDRAPSPELAPTPDPKAA
jgi:1-acyl-sn-glycerol-3-phosphate acyltransferase